MKSRLYVLTLKVGTAGPLVSSNRARRMLKLERYRENQHGPCARMTRNIVKDTIFFSIYCVRIAKGDLCCEVHLTLWGATDFGHYYCERRLWFDFVELFFPCNRTFAASRLIKCLPLTQKTGILASNGYCEHCNVVHARGTIKWVLTQQRRFILQIIYKHKAHWHCWLVWSLMQPMGAKSNGRGISESMSVQKSSAHPSLVVEACWHASSSAATHTHSFLSTKTCW